MNFEQYSHEPYIATVRFWTFAEKLDEHADELPGRRERGEAALDVMEANRARSRSPTWNPTHNVASLCARARAVS